MATYRKKKPKSNGFDLEGLRQSAKEVSKRQTNSIV